MRAYNLETALGNKEKTEELYLHQINLDPFPSLIFDLPNLRKLEITKCGLTKLPEQIEECQQLQVLNLSNNRLSALPSQLEALPLLHSLNLSANHLTSIPEEIFSLSNLVDLNLSNNELVVLPEQIGKLKTLEKLNVANNQIKKIHKAIGQCNRLTQLDLSQNRVSNIAPFIGKLKQLKDLNLATNRLKQIPEIIGGCQAMERLDLSENKLEALPTAIGQWPFLQQLFANKNKLTQLPNTIGQCRGLRKLQLKKNQLTTLPQTFQKLSSLKIVHLDDNDFKEIPQSVLALRKLTALHLCKNKIRLLPVSLSQLSELNILDLTDNPLEKIQTNFAQLTHLKAIHFRKAVFEKFPNNLLSAPSIQKMSGLTKLLKRKGKRFNLSQFIRHCNQYHLSFSLRNDLFDFLCNNQSFQGKWDLLDCVTAMNFPNKHVQMLAFEEILNRHSLDFSRHPLEEGSGIAFWGTHHFNNKGLRRQMTETGLLYMPTVNAETTHVVLGKLPNWIDAKTLNQPVVFMGEQILQKWFNQKRGGHFREASETQIQSLHQMLCSQESANVKMALQLLKGGGVPKSLLTSLFVAARSNIANGLKKEALALLMLNASQTTRRAIVLGDSLSRRLSKDALLQKVKSYTEQTELEEGPILKFLNIG